MNMNEVVLETSDKEKYVGVIIQNDLNPTKQCASAAAKANSLLRPDDKILSYRKKCMDIII